MSFPGIHTTYTDISTLHEQIPRTAAETHLMHGAGNQPIIDLDVVGHVTPYYVRKLEGIALKFAVELR